LDNVKKTRKQQAEATKRHIFDTALELLNQRDFEQIKVRDIVKAAQVSIGTFYKYYETKLDVFYETYQLADEYFEDTVAPLLTQESACQRILCFFNNYARYSCEITDISLTKILYNSNNKRFNRSGDRGMRSVLQEQIRYGLERGELHAHESETDIAEFLMIAARGLVYNWCTRDGAYPLPESMDHFIAQILKSYR